MRYYLTPEQRIERLEGQLDEARRAVLALLPEPLQRHIRARRDCATRRDGDVWEHALVQLVVDSAQILTLEEGGSRLDDRAWCPLCGGGTSDWSQNGYSVPEGLRRHLTGENQVARCRIAHVLIWWAYDEWEPRFQKADAEREAAEQAERARRREVEPLYVVQAGGAARLRDEQLQGYAHPGPTPRDEPGLAWADARLRALGFEPTIEDRVTTYRREIEGHIVHADPRRDDRLTFEVTVVEPPEASLTAYRRRQRALNRSTPRPSAHFDLPDRLKNDLPAKFAARLADAVRVLDARKPKARGKVRGES